MTPGGPGAAVGLGAASAICDTFGAVSELIPGDPLRTLSNLVRRAIDRVGDLVAGDEHEPLPTVDHVEPERYAGLWYELARMPMRFQADDSLSTAEYTVQDDGSIKVHNVSYDGTEIAADISGTATAAEGAEGDFNRLKVRFGGLLKYIPVDDDGNYWILKLDDEYRMALVGTPDRRSMWLLARDPATVTEAEVDEYLATARSLGFDTSKLLVADWENHRIVE